MPSEYSEQRNSEDMVSAPVEGQGPKPRNLDSSIVSKWESFFQETEYLQRIREVSDLYPELRSINVVYGDLDKADIELAIYLLEHPDLAVIAGKEAVRNLMHQEKRKSEINLRITALPRDSRVEIRDLRSKHVGKMISVEGLVRKATEVRPKLTAALFQCLRCGTVIKEQQEGLFFKEPMECYKEQNGCGRSAGSTKFKLLTDESKFIDTQKIEIQESPEGLRGGAQPERLVGYLEDDITGLISPGDRIVLNGILRSVQKGQPTKSTLFDINMDIVSAEHQQREYEEIIIDPDDEREIVEQAKSPDLFKKIVASISPTIYGYDTEKEAIALQLFSGVPKILDDGTRIRGDIHVLLVGDPGVAKCVTGDTDVWMADGSTRNIKQIVDEALSKGEVHEVDDGVWTHVNSEVLTFTRQGKMGPGKAVRAWKRKAPRNLIKVRTEKGRSLSVTPTHLLFAGSETSIRSIKASNISPGVDLICATGLAFQGVDDANRWKKGFELDTVDSVKEIDTDDEWVYDIEVEDTHKFVANGILSHNSQLLRYMSSLAPRGIYASGKSSSAAGLCVSPETIITIEGDEVKIGEFVEQRMKLPQEIKPGHWSQSIDCQKVSTISSDGRPTSKRVSSIWRIKTPSFLVELVENSGKRLTVTPETPLRCKPDSQSDTWVKASDIAPGQSVLMQVPSSDGTPEGFRWSSIKEKREITENLPRYVYDLTVDGSHSFIGNGFVVHNTAAAVKDEFGEGRWTLEAGALVLADKGTCCIQKDQLVATDRGLIPIEKIQVGDKVINYDQGRSFSRVSRVIDNGMRGTIKLGLYTGDTLECTPDHRVLTASGWKEAADLVLGDMLKIPSDYTKLKIVDTEKAEMGFIHGFALSDISINERSRKNQLGFAASVKNMERADYVLRLLNKHYQIEAGEYPREDRYIIIGGKEAHFRPETQFSFSSAMLKRDISRLFHRDFLPLDDRDFCIGFMAGIVSTDCCVSHKQGKFGIKHIIEIGIGRDKYGPEWTTRKQKMLLALLHSFGIMAVARGRKVRIHSLDSYNRLVDLVRPFVVGRNRDKLYNVVAKTRISSFDTYLDDDYVDWFSSIKFNTSETVRLGLHSRIYMAAKRRNVTTTLMEVLRVHWDEITDAKFREPQKDYLLNPVVKIKSGKLERVYDLTIDGQPNFLVSGGIVHNCIDELDKMTDQDRSAMHEAMEAQCYDDQTEVLTNHGWKFFKDLSINDLVASLAEGNKISYSKPSMYFEAEYQGDMFYIQSRQLNLAITPNHNMYVSMNNRANDWTSYGLVRMDELATKWHFKFKKNGVWEGQEVEFFRVPSVIKLLNQRNVGIIEPEEVFKMDDWLEFLGYFLSEGSVLYQNNVPYRLRISQVKDGEEIGRIERCLQRLGLKYSYVGHNFDLNNKELASYLSKFGGSPDKHVPRELMELSSRQLTILFDALMLGDGHRNERTHHSLYGTSSKRLADDVQEIAFKIGKVANIYVINNGRYVSTIQGRQIRYQVPHYVISIIDGNDSKNINEPAIFGSDNKSIIRRPYKGKIYCIQVPSHVLYVRRGGKPVWCGNSISVAKAGITATLQCRCSILGAANPKYGRFEEHQYIADQINLPPALMSRFDLIFAMTDKPDAVKDANLTDHILQAHRRGQLKTYADLSEVTWMDADKIIEETDALKPVFSRDFFRKYAAYSKRMNPILSDDAMKIIREYYLRIRKMGEGEGSSVPITARQLEAFVRLSEASARARLSQTVTKDDAERAVRIVDYYLRKIAGEAGKLDIDIITSGTSHSQREQITILRQLISELSDPRKGVSMEELVRASEAKNIAEDRVKTLVKRLSQNGEIFSPSSGYYKLTSEG